MMNDNCYHVLPCCNWCQPFRGRVGTLGMSGGIFAIVLVLIEIIMINLWSIFNMIKSQIQLQREELLLNSSQSAKRARMGSFLHEGKNHPEGFDKLSGNDHDDHWPWAWMGGILYQGRNQCFTISWAHIGRSHYLIRLSIAIPKMTEKNQYQGNSDLWWLQAERMYAAVGNITK